MPQAWFEIELTSEHVPNESVQIQLDTTAPTIAWGTPSSTAAGTTLTISYTISDMGTPHINFVRLRDSAGGITAGTFDGTTITIDIPGDSVNGPAFIEAETEDDVLNVALRSYPFNITEGIAPVEGQGFSAGRPFTYGAGAPAFIKEEKLIEAEASLLRIVPKTFAASIELQRKKTFEFSSDQLLLRSKVVELNCERSPASHYLQLRDEDELICLLMAD